MISIVRRIGESRGGRLRRLRPLAGLALLAGLAAASVPSGAAASALKVESAEFFVTLDDGEGNERTALSTLVPYLPNQACFGWRIRLTDAPAILLMREELHLPEAPAFWSGEDDTYSTHRISADRKTTTTEQYVAPRDGWLESSWCIVEGDPAGPHSIDVYLEGKLARHFDFEVKRVPE